MVDVPRAKLSEELLGSEGLEVVDEELPELEDVVAREVVPAFDDDDLGTEQLGFDGRAKAAGPGPSHQDPLIFCQESMVRLLAGLCIQDLEDLSALKWNLLGDNILSSFVFF